MRAVAFILLGTALLAADDLVLLDGKKISGTITGMEKGSFRVETDFGVALVRKDKVARIEMTTAKPAESKPPEKPAEKDAVPPPVARPAPVNARATPPPPAIQERKAPGGKIQEHVEGSTYINDSFGFEMFKPPNWKVLETAAQSVPSAVAVMGTEDEATVMLIGSVVFDGPPAAYAAVLDAALKKLYSDYEKRPEEQVTVAGLPAIRRSFRGMADGREWHGVAVNLADGKNHYGFIGVTSEEAYQFKSSVMGKMIASFKFR